MEKMEIGFTERMGKMESEVSQLREVINLTGEGRKANQSPSKRKFDQPPAKKKGEKKIGMVINDFDFGLSTQEMRDLSQDTFVEGFDLSQVKVENSMKSSHFNTSPPHLHDEQIHRAGEDSKDAALVFLREEDWEKEIDAVMFLFQERTTLKRWKPQCVAFITVVFSNMIKKEYNSFLACKRKYTLHSLLLEFGKGVLPPHGGTQEIWNVDVDRLYVPVHVSGNHWIALCISFMMRSIDVFDCSGRKRYKEVDAFAHLVPRIVKAVQPTRDQKDYYT
ncbi:hypothetical protein N665_0917s0008 [Sinapis alba]|nr:hypothetical protein N665_0917s0008 [Sinapis alba]